jgi:hypothetical protein
MRFANVDKSPVQPGEYVGVTRDDVVFGTYRRPQPVGNGARHASLAATERFEAGNL